MLVLKNEGPTVAEDVHVDFDPPIRRTAELSTPIDEIEALTTGITALSPGRQMSWILGGHPDIHRERTVERHRVTIRFRGPFGDVPPVSYFLDFKDFIGISIIERTTIKDVVKELHRLADNVLKPRRQ